MNVEGCALGRGRDATKPVAGCSVFRIDYELRWMVSHFWWWVPMYCDRLVILGFSVPFPLQVPFGVLGHYTMECEITPFGMC